MPKCRNCGKPIVVSRIYDNGWAHETSVLGKYDADICYEIKVAEPEPDAYITIDFTADELEQVVRAMKVTGETFSQFITRAIQQAINYAN